MLRKFLADRRGNYAMMTAIAMLPLMGGLALAVDYAEMTRQRNLASYALDAAAIATGRAYQAGTPEEQLPAYAKKFLQINANGLDTSKIALTLVLPSAPEGGGTLKLSAKMKYDPYFVPALSMLLGNKVAKEINLGAYSEVRLKNTLEVALVLDNSGSMKENGGSSGDVRMDLLKAAAKELVTTLAGQSAQMTHVSKPVQFSVVPFASAVNVGPDNETQKWMDEDGISPIHHENFDWSTMKAANADKGVELSGGVYYKRGKGWPKEEKVTRFTLYKEMQRITGQIKTGQECIKWKNGKCTEYKDIYQDTYGPVATWKGCVEARPSPYDVDDTPASSATPATMFVPMFGPDESDNIRSYNNWWPDVTSDTNAKRQMYMPKYFEKLDHRAERIRNDDKTIEGPNQSCTTTPITPLTDVSKDEGKTLIETAIDGMQPLGATNVPEGMAWGWRTLTSDEPFTGGRAATEKGNDKVVIVVTDGANTYYKPNSLADGDGNRYSDSTGNKSIYSALGYVRLIKDTTLTGRIFQGTGTTVAYENATYTTAMNEHFKTLCDNAKAKKIMVMTVALDLDSSKDAENTQIEMLKACASESRFRKDGAGKPMKLFWNSTGDSLAEDFKKIGDELSNLRIVG